MTNQPSSTPSQPSPATNQPSLPAAAPRHHFVLRPKHISVSGASICVALALALWEIYFFWGAGRGLFGPLDNSIGFFTPNRLGFNMAWLAAFYLVYQLVSIPFSASYSGKFLGVLDGMASLLPLALALIVVFGRPGLLMTADRWEAAFILIFITAADLFGGYAFNIALSRRLIALGGGPL